MEHEQLLSRVNQGRQAVLALQFLEPIFKECEKELMDSLKGLFRTGKYNELILACHTAQLVALDDIKSKLMSLERAGESSYEEMKHQQEDPYGNA